jgi:hypothetical protein
MIFPFDALIAEHRELGLVLAVLIGFGFGFVLERAGFGRASTLVGQFYLYNMTVFKVMFGAIVTAMLGLVAVSGMGLIDLTGAMESIASPTYLWPMLVGGFVLGMGFIISGYCPGTSAVSAASGNLDGMVTFGGVILGSLLYSEIQPAIASFHDSGALGQLFLPDLLGLHPLLLAVIIGVVAVGAFLGAEKAEVYFSRVRGVEPPVTGCNADRRLAVGSFAGIALLGVAALMIPSGGQADPPARALEQIDAATLAQRTLEEPWTLRVIDLRAGEGCAKARVPGAICVTPERLVDLGLGYVNDGRLVVLVAGGDLRDVPEGTAAYPGRLAALRGGFAAWEAYALRAPEPLSPDATADERQAWRLRAGLHAALTGTKQAPPPPAPVKKFVPKKKKGGGCS